MSIFFQADGLQQLGWCSNYMLDKRVLTYPKGSGSIKKKLRLLNSIGLTTCLTGLIKQKWKFVIAYIVIFSS